MKCAIAIYNHSSFYGRVVFTQDNNNVIVRGEIETRSENLMGKKFACHIHKYGDPEIHLMGGHYDKNRTEHPNHTGDLPNIHFSKKGMGKIEASLYNVTLEQLYGRAIVIHKNCDDMGAEENGHSGHIKSFAIISRSHCYTM